MLKEVKDTQGINYGGSSNDNMTSDFSTPQSHAINDGSSVISNSLIDGVLESSLRVNNNIQYLYIIISCHQTIFFHRSVMLERYCWTLEGRPRSRGVRGVSIVLCYKCIQFLVCSGISSWAKGYHAPWLDPRKLLLGSELVVHL